MYVKSKRDLALMLLAIMLAVLPLAAVLLPFLPSPVAADIIEHKPLPSPIVVQEQKTVTALPTLTAEKLSVSVGWLRQGDAYTGLRNLFGITVTPKGDVILVCVNDQPWGAKTGDTLTWHPNLYMDGVIVYPAGPTLLTVDPLNPNYKYNTLEWNYGVAKRWLRLIEGRVIERWVFYADPSADIRIEYNQSGDFSLKLGTGRDARGFPVEVKVLEDDVEFISKEAFHAVENYPVFIADSATFYPDAHPETSTVDGYVARVRAAGFGVSWDTIHDHAGSYNDDTATFEFAALIWADTGASDWKYLSRSQLLFDTSAIPDDATIDSAILSVYGADKLDALSITPNIAVYEGDTASNDDLVDGDYGRLLDETTVFSNIITYAVFSIAGYNAFTLNANGLANIDKTGVSKFCLRNQNYDVADVEPAWSSAVASYLSIYYAEQGVGFLPKLVVTYTPAGASVPTVTTLAATNVAATTATVHGKLTNDGGENCDLRFQYYAPGDDWASGNDTGWDGGFSTDDTHLENLTGLTPGTLYTFRVQGNNSAGIGNGTALTFTTEASVGNPSDLTIYTLPAELALVLSWTKGSGTTDTVVRYKEGSYPGSYTEGSSGGNPTTGSLKIIGLTAGTTYYFRLWGHSGGNYSAGYAEGMGTVSAAVEDEEQEAPDTPGLWFISTDYTRFSNMPLYAQINTFLDSLSVPRGTGWFLGALLMCVAVALAVLAKSGNGRAALIVFTVALAITCVLRLLPLWMIAFDVLVFMGIAKMVSDQRRGGAYS